jgi:hypothetical protein
MNRATAATAALALGTMVTAASIVPAMASPRLAAHHIAHTKTLRAAAAAKIAEQAAEAADPTIQIGSEEDNYKYETVVSCQGMATPPPITLGAPGTPLKASGVGPSAGILASLQAPNPYKTVYTCTVVVKEKVPPKPKPANAAPKVKPANAAPKWKPGKHAHTCELPAVRTRRGPGRGGKCTYKVSVETGFGGLAPQVRLHHPAG